MKLKHAQAKKARRDMFNQPVFKTIYHAAEE